MKLYNRGSEWRKCDFHIHTPESKLHSSFGENWDNYVKELFSKAIENQIEIIGITDYYSIEGYKKLKTEYLENSTKLEELFTPEQIKIINSILVLPNLEFRINKLILGNEKDLKWNRKVNYHIILSNDVAIDDIQENLIEKLYFENEGVTEGEPQKLNLTKRNLENLGERLIKEHDNFKGKSPLYVGMLNASIDDTELISVLNSQNSIFKGKYLLCLPADEDLSIVSWDTSGHLIRKVLIQKSHMIFSANPNTILFGLGKKHSSQEEFIKEFVTLKPCLWGSDAHSFDKLFKPELNRQMWIKADPTFEGLTQLLNEPEDRVFIGDIPKQKNNVDYNKEHFINKILIKSSSDNNEWFDKINEINLNPGLVSIIGNKGSGKSALADIIGCAGNANTDDYSFLKSGKFHDLKSCNKYSAKIIMNDGYESEKHFNNPKHDKILESKLVYFSQSFVQQLCEESDSSSLEKEINRVVFSHIPQEEQRGVKSLEELIEISTNFIDEQLHTKRKIVSEINIEIERLERECKKENLDKINSKLEEKKRQLLENDKRKPHELSDPNHKPDKEVENKLKNLHNELNAIIKIINTKQDELNNLVKDKESIRTNNQILKSFEDNYLTLKNQLKSNEVLIKYGINVDSLLSFNLNINSLEDTLKVIDGLIETKKKEKDEENQKKLNIESEILDITNRLSENEQKYKIYIEDLAKWEKKKNEILGEFHVPDTINYYDSLINKIKNINPVKLNELYDKRIETSNLTLKLIFNKKELLPKIYRYATEHAKSKSAEFHIDSKDFIEFDSTIKFSSEFKSDFLALINQIKKGTFRGIETGNDMLNKIIGNIDLGDELSISSLPSQLIYALKYDISDSTNISVNDVETQLLKNSLNILYDYIYSYKFLTINSEIKYGGVRIPNLSPGEKGTLLLIFYLLIDKDRRPIIIDQPEENLDNETVYLKLVPFVKYVKNERQIILVTHNPNLAIVCDSEQIIHAHIDKDKNNLVSYTCGSIENSDIRLKALNILEGTKPAFKNRKEKYKIN